MPRGLPRRPRSTLWACAPKKKKKKSLTEKEEEMFRSRSERWGQGIPTPFKHKHDTPLSWNATQP